MFVNNSGSFIIGTFTEDWISSTCGVSDVRNLEVVAPVESLTFSEQSLMAISFNYTDPDDGLVYFASARVEGASVTIRTAENMVDLPPVPEFIGLASVVGLAGDLVTLEFSEQVTGFDLSDLSLTNLRAENLATSDDITFTFDVYPTGDGSGTIVLPADAVQDLAGNGNTGSDTAATQAVVSRPEITFSSANAGTDPDERLYTFLVTVPGGTGLTLDAAGVSVTNGEITSQGLSGGSAVEYDLNVRPTGGNVTVSFAEGSFIDAATGNASAAAGPIFMEAIDLTPPTVSLTGTSGFPGDPVAIEIVFDEPVIGFVAGDIEVAGAVVSAFVNTCGSDPCAGFTATLTAEAGQEFSYSARVPAGVATDAAGNPNEASDAFTPPAPDGIAPVLTITGVPDGFAGPMTASISFDWGEDVFGFSDGDITVTGGALGPISGGPRSWTADLRADGDAAVTISVAAAAVQDATGTPSLAASAIGRIASGEVASRLIGEFMASRASALLAAQPRLSRLLTGAGDPAGRVSVTRGAGDVQLSTGTRGPVWVALDAQWGEVGASETTYTHLSFGSHARLGEATILGVMLQLDHATSREGAAEIEGTGWLVGPYFATVLGQGPLYLDGRLLWGMTDNEISPFGTYTDSFDTERWLATLALSGQIDAARATLLPQLQYAYTEDRQEAYLDSLSNPVRAQTISQGELSASLGWEMPVDDLGLTLFTGEVSGIWGVQDGGGSVFDGSRGRLELGLSHETATGLQMTVGGYLDGIGGAALMRRGVKVSLDWQF